MPETILTFIEKYPFLIAPFFGIIPALVWLWFWLKEDAHPEPPKMITLSFLGGMLAVLFVLPVEKWIYDVIKDTSVLAFILWATLEEVFKFASVYLIALQNKATDEPIDDMIYMIIGALGFVSLENTLFLIGPLRGGDFTGTLVTGNLRFIGASLLHIISSATIGVFMSLSFFKSTQTRIKYIICGIILAIVLHTTFNLFIINGADKSIFLTFGVIWTGIVALLVLFEKIKKIKKTYER